MDRRADPRRWARLLFCLAFYMVLTGLPGAILTHLGGVPRPEKALFLPSLAVAFLAGWFYTFDRPGGRLAEAGNLAGALTALRLWADLAWLQPASGLSAGEFFLAWWTWGSYLGNVAVIMLAGLWMERRR